LQFLLRDSKHADSEPQKYWEKILFLRYYIWNVAVPLGVPEKVSLEFSELVLESSFGTKAMFNALIDFLIRLDSEPQASFLLELYVSEFCFRRSIGNSAIARES
jgi:hypothetical protein